jgi:hypothetical protein
MYFFLTDSGKTQKESLWKRGHGQQAGSVINIPAGLFVFGD